MKKHVATKITALIGIVVVISMTILFFVVNYYITNTLQEKAMQDMSLIARDRAQLVETYIQGCCEFVDAYSKTPEVKDVLMNPKDADCLDAVRKMTKDVSEGHDYIEGLYTAQWDTYVLAHINPDSMDKVFRESESAKELEKMIREMNTSFCTGIVLAPVTKKMVIPVYAPVFNNDGEAIGFVGGAFYTDGLSESLSSLIGKSEVSVGYSLLNGKDSTYIFDNDFDKVGMVCGDENLNEAIEILRAPEMTDEMYSYISNEEVVSCFHMMNRDWVFVVTDSITDVFSVVGVVRTALIVICVLVTILLVVTCALTVSMRMRPLKAINNQIIRMGKNDLSYGHSIDKHKDREDEFGSIARAVLELNKLLDNQYELFLEMLKAQTVGTLVTRNNNGEVMMINDKALELMNLKKHVGPVTIQDIRSQFNEDSVAIVDENMALLNEKEDGEVSYEISIEIDGNLIFILTNAKHIVLSNGDDVIIMSLTDITERKRLEDNLKILSETDALTGLCNRRSGEARVRENILLGKKGMFCLFDADRFKHINDTYGHSAGDAVLKRIAEEMKKSFRDSDVLIRLGGDEFVIFALGIEDYEIGKMVIDRFLINLSLAEVEEIKNERINVSLGAFMVGEDMNFKDMCARADAAMYLCKKEEGSTYRFYRENDTDKKAGTE